MSFAISGGVALLAMICVQCCVVPTQKKRILSKFPYSDGIHVYQDTRTITIEDRSQDEEARVNLLFHFIQILAAIFGSFAHGGKI
jgi:phosphate/sulfate permease